MLQNFNVLVIDDHPLIINNYICALNSISDENPELSFTTKTANDCDSANALIEKAACEKPFDLIFLDIRLPVSTCGKILSGEDLGIKAMAFFPEVKIIVLTSYNDNFRLNSILRNINPDCFILKQDITFAKLIHSIKTVIFDPPYYSKAIIKLFRTHATNDFTLDALDRKLLYHISLGSKMKDLPKVIPLSMASIERRKKRLKTVFNIDEENDKLLITKAKAKGFI